MRRKMAGLVALTTIVAASCGAAPPESGAPSESIQVHGDWTIEVYNEDGTLDERVDFSNALVSPELLGAFLSRVETPGRWQVSLADVRGVGAQPCGAGPPCLIAEPDHPFTRDSNDLTVAVTSTGVMLTGSVVVSEAAELGFVSTNIRRCVSDVAPSGCAGNIGGDNFTEKSIAGVAVAAGQTVQVQVDISFTTG